jgi:hypothetical protein
MPPPAPWRQPATEPRDPHHRPLARWYPATRAYLDRKHAEGKSKREPIRCLKRNVARRIWRVLYATTPPPDERPVNPNGAVKGDAPALMPCTR